jgi:hypothetical protein
MPLEYGPPPSASAGGGGSRNDSTDRPSTGAPWGFTPGPDFKKEKQNTRKIFVFLFLL